MSEIDKLNNEDATDPLITKELIAAYIKPVVMYVPFIMSAVSLFWVGSSNKDLTLTQASIMVIAAMILVLPWISSIKFSKEGVEVKVAEAMKEVIAALSSFGEATNTMAVKSIQSSKDETPLGQKLDTAMLDPLSTIISVDRLRASNDDFLASIKEGNEHLEKASKILNSISRAS